MSKKTAQLPRHALVVGSLAFACGSLGCGMLSAVTNPSAAFAIQEPSNLGVVVRRAEIARATSNEVDRLLGSTPLNDDSAWLEKVALKQEDASALVKAASGESVYAGSQTRVVSAEAWAHGLALVCSDGSARPNVIAASGPEAAKLYADISAERKAIGKLKMQVDEEKKAADASGVPADKKTAHEKKAEQLEAEIEKLEKANEDKVSKLVDALKKPSSAPGPLKDKLRTVVLNLTGAVKESRDANSAAMLGYPLALKGITSEVQKAAPRFVADVIEDKTGTRPESGGIKPDVKLEGTDVKLTLNGLTKEQLASLSIGDVVSETTSRLTAYVKLAVSIPVFASETEDLLKLQQKLLEAYLEGLGGGGSSVDLSKVAVQAAQAPAAAPAAAGDGKPKGKRMTGGLLIAHACEIKKDDEQPVVAAAVVPPAGGATPAEPKTAEAKQPETAAEPAKAREEDSKPAEPAKNEPPAETAKAEEAKPAEGGGSPLKTIGFIGLAVGGAGLVGGTVVGIMAASKHGDLKKSCDGTDCPPPLHTQVEEYRTLGNVSTAALIGGGAFAAVGLVLIVASPSKAPSREQGKPKPKVVPYVGLGSAGAVGRF